MTTFGQWMVVSNKCRVQAAMWIVKVPSVGGVVLGLLAGFISLSLDKQDGTQNAPKRLKTPLSIRRTCWKMPCNVEIPQGRFVGPI